MLLYLSVSYEEWRRRGILETLGDLREGIYQQGGPACGRPARAPTTNEEIS